MLIESVFYTLAIMFAVFMIGLVVITMTIARRMRKQLLELGIGWHGKLKTSEPFMLPSNTLINTKSLTIAKE